MNENPPIRVMLVDDHAIVRYGLAALLQGSPDFTLIAEAEDGKEAIELCQQMTPDVILMDLKMPLMDGLTATQLIVKKHPHIFIIILTSTFEEQLVRATLRAGAVGFLLKSADIQELAQAIHTVYNGELYLIPAVSQLLMQNTTKRAALPLGHDLSAREMDVLKLIVKGWSNQEIADDLLVTTATAKFHVGKILSKLHVRSRTEAVVTALEHNLVSTIIA